MHRMESKLESTWEAFQSLVVANPRIHAIKLRDYIHVWTRTDNGEVLRKSDRPERLLTRRRILQHRTTAEELRDDLEHYGSEAKYWQVSLSSDVMVKRRGIGFLPGKLGKKTQYVALLDMDLPISDENTSLIRERASELLLNKYGSFLIAESGNSYHLIGTELLSRKKLLEVYGTSLLLDVNKHVAKDGVRKHVVDSLYIGHCLAERNGSGHLRLTGNHLRPVPRVVGQI